jgi:hypothetical protein
MLFRLLYINVCMTKLATSHEASHAMFIAINNVGDLGKP